MASSLHTWLLSKRDQLFHLMIVRANSKVTLIWIIFVLGSFSHDYFPLPSCYFSKSSNILNQYFVKIGWLWTSLLVSVYMFGVLLKHRIDSKTIYAKHLARLAVLTATWFVCTSLFEYIEALTGYCIGVSPDTEILTKKQCRAAGHLWSGFDISGHCFLLSFCILIINEELSRASSVVASEPATTNHVGEEPIIVLGVWRVKEAVLLGCLQLLKCGLVVLMMLWKCMLLFTCLYFHDMLQKLLGLLFGLLSYYLCYRVLFHQQGLLLLADTVGNKNS
jgi:hypothetical protein